MPDQRTLFDYNALDSETRIVVKQRTSEIRGLMRRAAQDIIDIGQKLIEVKEQLPHGQFGGWLETEFQWGVHTARNFMRVTETFSEKEKISLFAPSALYLLAAPSTPEAARQEAIARAESGEHITHTVSKQIVAEHKRSTPAPAPAPAPAQPATMDIQAQSTHADTAQEFVPQDDREVYPEDLGEDSRYQREAERQREKRERQQAQAEADAATIAEITARPITERYQLLARDIADLERDLAAGSVDVILTDPPYPKDYLVVYAHLAQVAAHCLKPGGSCFVMIGQSYLPNILALMTPHLTYHWTLTYLTPGGQATQLWQRKVNTFWKPVLWFVNGGYDGPWMGDVAQSRVNDNDKRFHCWGQSESGMVDLVQRCSRPGDTILDPFCGGGTTGVVALTLGRLFIGADHDDQALETTRNRLYYENTSA